VLGIRPTAAQGLQHSLHRRRYGRLLLEEAGDAAHGGLLGLGHGLTECLIHTIQHDVDAEVLLCVGQRGFSKLLT